MPKLIGLCMLLLCGCAREIPNDSVTLTTGEANRFSVSRVAVFKDQLAYDGQRGIYVIADKTTGRSYLGVSGIGISELGEHDCGKNCTREDER